MRVCDSIVFEIPILAVEIIIADNTSYSLIVLF